MCCDRCVVLIQISITHRMCDGRISGLSNGQQSRGTAYGQRMRTAHSDSLSQSEGHTHLACQHASVPGCLSTPPLVVELRNGSVYFLHHGDRKNVNFYVQDIACGAKGVEITFFRRVYGGRGLVHQRCDNWPLKHGRRSRLLTVSFFCGDCGSPLVCIQVVGC